MVDTSKGAYRPTWKNRRRTIFGSLIYAAVSNGYITMGFSTVAPAVASTIITMNIILAVGVIGSYVFGATWDDKNILANISEV